MSTSSTMESDEVVSCHLKVPTSSLYVRHKEKGEGEATTRQVMMQRRGGNRTGLAFGGVSLNLYGSEGPQDGREEATAVDAGDC